MHALVRTKAVCGGKSLTNPGLALGISAALSGFLAACGDPDEPGGTTTAATMGGTSTVAGATGTTGAATGCLSATAEDGSLNLLVDPANNYTFDSEVTLRVLPIAPNTPLGFDWSGLSIDLMQQPINPAAGEVAAIVVALLNLTVQEFQDKLNANEKLENYSRGALALYPSTQTAASLYDFGAVGSPEPLSADYIDPFLDPGPFPPETHTFAVIVQDETAPARGVRMVQALQIDAGSLIAHVPITNDSSDLWYETDLTSIVPVQLPASTVNVTVDWKHLQEVAQNGLGDLWLERSVDEVMVARYSLTPAQLTEQFLSLEKIADQSYRAPVAAGAKLNLSALTEATSGTPFPGIDATGTWVLALFCSKCANPAPWFLTILQACP